MSSRTAVGIPLIALVLFGCGGGGTNPGGGDVTMAKASASGDAQSGPFGTVLANPLQVLLTQGGSPLAGRAVTWQAQAGIQLSPVTTTSGVDGIARTVVTLPPFGSIRTITATASGAIGSPQVFTVTATGAGTAVTVEVVNNEFLPSTFNLKAGGIVTFTWGAGAAGHSVAPVAPNTIPASSNPAPPGLHSAPYNFAAVFPSTGTFKFFCDAHGNPDIGMHGTITVVP